MNKYGEQKQQTSAAVYSTCTGQRTVGTPRYGQLTTDIPHGTVPPECDERNARTARYRVPGWCLFLSEIQGHLACKKNPLPWDRQRSRVPSAWRAGTGRVQESASGDTPTPLLVAEVLVGLTTDTPVYLSRRGEALKVNQLTEGVMVDPQKVVGPYSRPTQERMRLLHS